jgi:acetyl esterase/lipase
VLVPSESFNRLLSALQKVPLPDELPSVEHMRAGMERFALDAADDLVTTSAVVAGVEGEWVRAPGASEEHVLLYLHGGGYVMGSPNTHRKLCGDLSRATGMLVWLPDYPLAPEAPFPQAIEALAPTYEHLVGLVGASNLVIAGDSAGGGLTVALLLAARDAGQEMPAAAVCISPWADLARADHGESPNAATDPIVRAEDTARMVSWYLAGADPLDPLASPARADLQGLPPLLVHVGSTELLLDDAVTLAEQAEAAGVKVTLEVWPDMVHVWHLFAGRVPEATDAVARIGEFIHAELGHGA